MFKKIIKYSYFTTMWTALALIISAYLFGSYTMLTNDKYSKKEAILGIIGFPYGTMIGVSTFFDSIKSYDLYPYSLEEILSRQKISELSKKGYTKKEIEYEAYKTLVTVLNGVDKKYRTEKFLKDFHQKKISFSYLRSISH